MYNNTTSKYDERYHEEYSFPNLPPSSVCRANIKQINKKNLLFKTILYTSLILCSIFCVLTIIFFFRELLTFGSYDEDFNYIEYTPDYSKAIIFGIIFIATLIPLIVSAIFVLKYTKQVNTYKNSIKINTQYFEFIYQGYSKRDAYRLTLEWIDRQSQNEALKNLTNTTYVTAFYQINNMNNR